MEKTSNASWHRREKNTLGDTAKVTLRETAKVTMAETAKVTWERLGEVREDAVARAHNNLYMI